MEDIIKQLKDVGFEPETQEDLGDFEPINGRYICRIDSAGRLTGTSERTGEPYDFRTISIQVTEIISGDKATNRFLKLRYNHDIDGTKKLLNDLFTAGIEASVKNEEELDALLESLKDKTVNVRAWVWTPKTDRNGNNIAEEDRKSYQSVKIVKEFKEKKKPETAKSNVPF